MDRTMYRSVQRHCDIFPDDLRSIVVLRDLTILFWAAENLQWSGVRKALETSAASRTMLLPMSMLCFTWCYITNVSVATRAVRATLVANMTAIN